MEMTTTKERDLLFDNIRGVLIFLVIVGHLISDRRGEVQWLKDIYYTINMFHMATFIFILGYFSKNTQKSVETAVSKFLIPYVIFDLIMGIVDYLLFIQTNEPKVFFDFFKITFPRYGLWFLLSSFFYKVFSADIKKFRFSVPVALVIGLCIPYFPDIATKFALGRTFGYLFFFTLGLWFKPEFIEKIRKAPAFVGWISFLLAIAYSVYACENKIIKKRVLIFKYPYDDGKKMKQLIMRVIIYLVACIFIMSLIILMTKKRCFLSKIGMNSMTVYLFHLFVIKWDGRENLFKENITYYFIFALVYAALLTWIFSRDIFMKLYNKIMKLTYLICYKKETIDNDIKHVNESEY